MIVIVGGSIAGLMAGIVFRNRGYDVQVLEESITAQRDSHAAGIRLGSDAQLFLQKHGVLAQEDSVPCDGLQFINRQGNGERFIDSLMRMTSWECLFHRLRGSYYGISSRLCPTPPPSTADERGTEYRSGMRVTDIALGHSGKMRVSCEDLGNANAKEELQADQVILADGANSRLRNGLESSSAVAPNYAGYVAWRGTVKESDVSDATRQAIGSSFLVHKTPPNYILVYTIPGETGSTQPGQRIFNFVWYYQCPEQSRELDTIMTDANGHRHRATVQPGAIDLQVWERQQAYGRSTLAPPFVELIEKTKQPFISTVREAQASQASYFHGRVRVIGDALATFRPHIAMSVNQAAVNCLQLEKLLDGELTGEQWQNEVERYARVTSRLSTLAGDFAMWPFSWRLLSSAAAYLWELAIGSVYR